VDTTRQQKYRVTKERLEAGKETWKKKAKKQVSVIAGERWRHQYITKPDGDKVDCGTALAYVPTGATSRLSQLYHYTCIMFLLFLSIYMYAHCRRRFHRENWSSLLQ